MSKQLYTQAYLRLDGSIEGLKELLGINAYRHPALPLVGLKYSQIDSPKFHPIVRECRGLVLEEGSRDVVAKPFGRFFNVGEDPEGQAHFDWETATYTAKEDGSLILLYHYQGEWHVNTSGSFGLGKCGHSGKTWREVFWEVSRLEKQKLDPACTYLFELWTPYNKVVRSYPKPTAFLLSIFDNQTLEELTQEQVRSEARAIGVECPDGFRLCSIEQAREYLVTRAEDDPTFEGFVIDGYNRRPGYPVTRERHKLKSPSYLALHRLLDNGNAYNPKNLIPILLAGEAAELLAYFPEMARAVSETQERLILAFEELVALWRSTWQIPSQREFALAIVGKSRFACLLFTLRKAKGTDQTEQDLLALWRESSDLIVKAFMQAEGAAR